jgi:hypothetical protein
VCQTFLRFVKGCVFQTHTIIWCAGTLQRVATQADHRSGRSTASQRTQRFRRYAQFFETLLVEILENCPNQKVANSILEEQSNFEDASTSCVQLAMANSLRRVVAHQYFQGRYEKKWYNDSKRVKDLLTGSRMLLPRMLPAAAYLLPDSMMRWLNGLLLIGRLVSFLPVLCIAYLAPHRRTLLFPNIHPYFGIEVRRRRQELQTHAMELHCAFFKLMAYTYTYVLFLVVLKTAIDSKKVIDREGFSSAELLLLGFVFAFVVASYQETVRASLFVPPPNGGFRAQARELLGIVTRSMRVFVGSSQRRRAAAKADRHDEQALNQEESDPDLMWTLVESVMEASFLAAFALKWLAMRPVRIDVFTDAVLRPTIWSLDPLRHQYPGAPTADSQNHHGIASWDEDDGRCWPGTGVTGAAGAGFEHSGVCMGAEAECWADDGPEWLYPFDRWPWPSAGLALDVSAVVPSWLLAPVIGADSAHALGTSANAALYALLLNPVTMGAAGDGSVPVRLGLVFGQYDGWTQFLLSSHQGMMALGSIAAVFKLLHLCSTHQDLGPLILCVYKVLFQVLMFSYLLLVSIIGFSMAFTLMLRPIRGGTGDIDGDGVGDGFDMLNGTNSPDPSAGEDEVANARAKFSTVLDGFWTLLWAVFGSEESVRLADDGLLFQSFGLAFMMYAVLMLTNLLIAMMSGTYESIFADADTEYKFALARLIDTYDKKKLFPPPFNIPGTMCEWARRGWVESIYGQRFKALTYTSNNHWHANLKEKSFPYSTKNPAMLSSSAIATEPGSAAAKVKAALAAAASTSGIAKAIMGGTKVNGAEHEASAKHKEALQKEALQKIYGENELKKQWRERLVADYFERRPNMWHSVGGGDFAKASGE